MPIIVSRKLDQKAVSALAVSSATTSSDNASVAGLMNEEA